MTFGKITAIVWGSIIAIIAIFAIPLLFVDLQGYLMLMPFLMTGLFLVIFVIVGVFMYKVFVAAGRKRAGMSTTGAEGITAGQAAPGEAPVFASDAAPMASRTASPLRGFSRGLLILAIGGPLLISVIGLIVPLVVMSKRDDIGNYLIAKTIGKYEITSATLTDPFTPPEKSVFKPDAGNRWVMVTLTVRNVGDKVMDISEMEFHVITADGSEHKPNIVADSGKEFAANDLAPGATFTGNIVFEIPAGATPADIVSMQGERMGL